MPSQPAFMALSRAAEENARSLVSDAEVLLSAGRWPRAYSLAVLAHEEFGKSLMAFALFSIPRHCPAAATVDAGTEKRTCTKADLYLPASRDGQTR